MMRNGFVLLVFCTVSYFTVMNGHQKSGTQDAGPFGIWNFFRKSDSNLSASPTSVSTPSFKGPYPPKGGPPAKSIRTERRLDPKTNTFKPIRTATGRHGFNVGSERWNVASKTPAKDYGPTTTTKQVLDRQNEALKKIVNDGDPCKISAEGAQKNCAMATDAYLALAEEEGKGCRLAKSPEPQCRPIGGDTVCSVKPSPPELTRQPSKLTMLEVWMKCRAEKFFSLNDCVAEIDGGIKLKWD